MIGDFVAGATVRTKFNTKSGGTPITLVGGVVSVYKDGSTTQSTAGVTLTADFDGVTGYHNVAIDTSADGTFYSAGSDFEIVLTAGTVDGVSQAGTVLDKFAIANRVAAIRADVERSGGMLQVTQGHASTASSEASLAKTAANSVDTKLTSQRATNLDNLDAAISTVVTVDAVTADRVAKQMTFYVGSEGNTSRNIITLNAWSSGTKTLAYDLSELLNQADTALSTVSTVTVVKGATSITTSNLRKHQNGKIAMWDTAAIATANAGTYVVTVTVTTADSNTHVLTGTLVVE